MTSRPGAQEIVGWLHEYRDLTDQLALIHCRIDEWREYFARNSKLLMDNWERIRHQKTNIVVVSEDRENFSLEPDRMNVGELHRLLAERSEITEARHRLKRKLCSQQLGNILKD